MTHLRQKLKLLGGLLLVAILTVPTSALAQSPGGVSANLSMWFRANNSTSTTTDGEPVDTWTAYVGGITATAGATKPVYNSDAINFNPAVHFSDNPMSLDDLSGLPTGGNDRTMIFVATSETNSGYLLGYGNSLSSAYQMNLAGVYLTNPWFDGGYNAYQSTGLDFNTEPTIVSYMYASQQGIIEQNGTPATDSPYDYLVAWNTGNDQGHLGGHSNLALGSPWTGSIAEAIVYNSNLNGTDDMKKVETYLAVKYGLTKAGDYMAANGTVIWDATTNSAYHNRITAIGVQATSHFVQAKSLSEHGGILTIEGNPANFADGSYLVVGDNNATLDYGNTAGSYDHINRVWKVAKTGTIGNVTLDIASNIPDAIYLLVSSSTDFSSATKYDLSGSTVTVDLADGQFFTFAKDGVVTPTTAPGGVATNLSMWFKANEGPDATVNGADVNSWVGQGPNGITATAGTSKPVYATEAINFNPAVHFSDNPMALDDLSGLPTGGNDRTMLFVATSETTSGYLLGYGNSLSSAYQMNLAGVYLTDPWFDGGYNAYLSTGLNFNTEPTIVSYMYASQQGIVEQNGNPATDSPYDYLVAWNTGNDQGHLGGHSNLALGSPWTGNIAEAIVYNSNLNGSGDLTKIETYLALKYGLTISGNYVSAGGTTIWDATANSAYSNRITGIAYETASGLNQPKSISTHSGILTIDAGTLSTDNSYMLVGDNNATLDYGNTAGSYDHINRIWKVSETGTIGNVTLDIASNIPDAIYLLVSSSTDFSSATKYDLTGSTVSVDLTDGQFFTFAKDDGYPPVTSVPGNALAFDGIDDEVVIPNSTELENYTNITIEAWVKPTGFPQQYCEIVSKTATSTDGYELYYDDINNQVGFSLYGVGGMVLNYELQPDTYYHIAFTYDGSNFTGYINGLYWYALPASGTPITNTTPVVIGNYGTGSDYNFEGEIDEVRIWNTARSEAQIQANIYDELSNPAGEANLVAYYKFNEASGTTLADGKDYNDGTLQGATGTLPQWTESFAMVVSPTQPATDITTNSFTANWLAPENGTPTGYRVIYTDEVVYETGFVNPMSVDVAAPNLSAAISGLNPGTTYYYYVVPLNSDLSAVGAWRYDENEYEYVTVTTLSNPTAAPGNALELDGVDDYVELGGLTPALNWTSSMTWEAWFKTSNVPGTWANIIGSEPTDASAPRMRLMVGNSGLFADYFVNGSNEAILNATADVVDNRWHHAAVVNNMTSTTAGTLELYLDGDLIATTDYTFDTEFSTSQPVYIGKTDFSSQYLYEGMIDEVRVWQSARSEQDLRDNMYIEIADPSSEADLVAYYGFNESSGTTTADQKGSYDGTLHNMNGDEWTESYALVAPPALVATGITSTGFTANWSAPVTGTLDGYYLDVATDADFTNLVLDGQDVTGATSFDVTGLTESTQYYYRVNSYLTALGDVGAWHYFNPIPVTTTAALTTGPGGVTDGLVLWTKADEGVTETAGTVTAWDDLSGSNNLTVNGDPQIVEAQLNYNPLINFDGDGDYFVGDASIDFQEAFWVGNFNSANGRVLAGDGTTGGSCGSYFFMHDGSSYFIGDEVPTYFSITADGTSYSLLNGLLNGTSSHVRLNGNQSDYTGTLSPFNRVPVIGICGTREADSELDGTIGDLVLFERALTDTERTQVESYLAIKYGITKADNYIVSDETVIWDATANATYHNRVTAIGQDDASALDQTMSLNIQSDAIVTIGSGASLGNGNFFAIGDNDGTIDFGNIAGSYDHINRTWLVAETGTVGSVTLDIASNISGALYLLVSDTEGDFSAATKYDLTSGSVSVDLTDGQYFTFAKDAPSSDAPGNALQLDGVDDYVELGGLTPALNWTSSMTWEAWFKTSNVPGTWANIIGSEPTDASAPRMRLMVGNSGLFADYFVNGSNEAILNATADVVDNRWHHAAVVNNMTSTTAGTLELYLDGDLIATTDYTFDTEFSTSQPVYIGKTDFSSQYLYEGMIDEVRVWQSARSEQDLRDNMYIEIADPSSEADLVAYYGFNETSGTTTADQKGSYDGTLHNMNGDEWTESYALVAPPALVATGITSTGFTANWSAPVTGTLDGYYLDVATDADFTNLVLAGQDVTGATSFDVTGLTESTQYYYRVNSYLTALGDVGAWHYFNPIPVATPADDQSPIISSSNTVSAPENQTDVITVTATDPQGEGITYSITGGTDETLFEIDPATGELTFITLPDFENPSDSDGDGIYEVEVTATDESGNATPQTITITLTNVDEAPEVVVDTPISVEENQTGVTTVTATDPEGGEITFEITGGTDETLFEIDPETGEITFITPPDFENPSDSNGDGTYEVEITVTDENGNSTTEIITITLTNVDEAPEVVVDTPISVEENATTVTTVTATDPEGGEITFEITGGTDESLFEIDPETGEITFITPPDFENPSDSNGDGTYEVEITVTDENGNSTTEIITITLTNVDEAPEVVVDTPISVEENASTVTTVTATDPEGGEITFEITGGTDETLFEIDPETGEVTFITAPDFEEPNDSNGDGTYEVEITVTDENGNKTIKTLVITVVDVSEAITEIEATNVLTPNNDGKNDVWVVGNINQLKEYELFIFNNIGEVIYQTTSYDNTWDATYNGNTVAKGTYYYMFVKEDEVFKGVVTVIY